jgi:thiazole synthase
VIQSGVDVITLSLRRETAQANASDRFWDYLRDLKVRLLPNTAGCRSAREAVTTARLARDLFDTNWIKLEVIGDEATLQPDPFGLVEAATELCRDGFQVFPYTTDDLVVAERLVAAGCAVLMPWGAPIGTGRGLANPAALAAMRARFPTTRLIVDAGIGRPSHACQAMELGYDAVLVNTAVATAGAPAAMAAAFAAAVVAGRSAYESGMMLARDRAVASTPTVDRPFASEAWT